MAQYDNWKISALGERAEEVRDLYEPNKGEESLYIGLEHIEQQSLRITAIGSSSDTISTKKIFQSGDILFGSLRPYFRKVARPKFRGVCSTDITVIRAKEDTDQGFLQYFIANQEFIDHASNISSGTRMPRANWKVLAKSEWRFPSLPTQRKIAATLSAHDDLIENNLRRIKILEEMAQNLYQEWFVKFRFPGHENVQMVDSPLGKIPEGWEVATISEVCSSFEDGDWIETKDQSGNDYRLLQVSNIGVGKFIETGNFRYVTEGTFTRLHCTEVIPGDILISRMPKPTGRAWLVTLMPWRMITAVDVAIARANLRKANSFFLLHHLNSPENLELIEKHQTGTTRPRISRKNLGALPLALPPRSLQERFRRFAASTYELITSLRRKNQTLQQTRDLLLPKLISGELDMSDLDIKTGGHMQYNVYCDESCHLENDHQKVMVLGTVRYPLKKP